MMKLNREREMVSFVILNFNVSLQLRKCIASILLPVVASRHVLSHSMRY